MSRDRPDEDGERQKRRRGRNIAMLVVLLGLAVLFYLIAVVKMSHGGG
jgi:hypothetical protein